LKIKGPICKVDHSTIEKNVQESVESKTDLIKLNFKVKEEVETEIEEENVQKIEEIEIKEEKIEEIQETVTPTETEKKEKKEIVKKNSPGVFKGVLNVIIIIHLILLQIILIKKFA
jgi:hypothetical protein